MVGCGFRVVASGNNVYGEDIPPLVDSLSPEELGSYILMDKIETATHLTNMVMARIGEWL